MELIKSENLAFNKLLPTFKAFFEIYSFFDVGAGAEGGTLVILK